MKHDKIAWRATRADPLAPLRAQFELPEGVIYLDGNSLGARPRAALARAQDVIAAEWGDDLIRSWNTAGWFDLPQRLGNRLAPLIGAAPAKWSSPTPPRSTCSRRWPPPCRCRPPIPARARDRHRARQLPHRYLHGRRG